MAMELGHTLGLVPTGTPTGNPPGRDDFYSRFHPNLQTYLQPDTTKWIDPAVPATPNRGYNVGLRTFLSKPSTAMALTGTWNNKTVLFEPDDYLALLCPLGGTRGGLCPTSARRRPPPPAFVISGTTDSTAAGTAVVEPYFDPGAARTPPAPRGVSARAAGGGRQLPDPRAGAAERSGGRGVGGSQHDKGAQANQAISRGLFSAVPFNTGAARIELVKGTTVLYASCLTLPPVIADTTVDPGKLQRRLRQRPGNHHRHRFGQRVRHPGPSVAGVP